MLWHKIQGAGGSGDPTDIKFVYGIATTTGTGVALSGAAPNDIVIAFASSDDNTLSYPLGYTGIALGRTAGSAISYMASYKIMGSPADASIDFPVTGGGTSNALMIFRNVDTTTPLDVTPPSVVTSSSSAVDPPSITTTTDKCAIIAIGMVEDTAVTLSAPSGYIAGAFRSGGTKNPRSSITGAYKLNVGIGTENPGAFNNGATYTPDSAALTIALRKA